MRSTQLSFFLSRISEINNYLSHILFILEQFNVDKNALLKDKKTKDKLTTDIFKNNNYSKIHNVKLSFLNKQNNESIDFFKNTIFLSINTQFEVYLKDIYLFKKENFDEELQELNKFKVYKDFIENLGLSKHLNKINASTYDYFVLRRNALVHRDNTKLYQGELAAKVKADGKKLNREWKRYSATIKESNLKSHTIETFNFSQKDISTFTFEELIDTINFYRLYSNEIDKVIVSELDRSKVEKYLFTNFKIIYQNPTYNKYLRKFNHFTKREFNIEMTQEELEKIWNSSSDG